MTVRGFKSKGAQYNLDQRLLARQDSLYKANNNDHPPAWNIDPAVAMQATAISFSANTMYLSRLKGVTASIRPLYLYGVVAAAFAGRVGMAVYVITGRETPGTALKLIDGGWTSPSTGECFVKLNRNVTIGPSERYLVGMVMDGSTTARGADLQSTSVPGLGSLVINTVTETSGFPSTAITSGTEKIAPMVIAGFTYPFFVASPGLASGAVHDIY